MPFEGEGIFLNTKVLEEKGFFEHKSSKSNVFSCGKTSAIACLYTHIASQQGHTL